MNFCLPNYVTTLNKGSATSAVISKKRTCGALVTRWKGFDGRVSSQTFSVGPNSKHRIFTRVVILSVYAPTGNHSDRSDFFVKLAILVINLRKQKKLVILTGDLNLAPAEIDRSSKTDRNNERAIFATFITATGLIDAFREKHPKLEAASFSRNASTSRIDHILVDPALEHAIISAKILLHKSYTASDQGDHRMTIVNFNKSMIFGKAPPPPNDPDPKPPPLNSPTLTRQPGQKNSASSPPNFSQ